MDDIELNRLRGEYASRTTEHLIGLKGKRSLSDDQRAVLAEELKNRGQVEDLSKLGAATAGNVAGGLFAYVVATITASVVVAVVGRFLPRWAFIPLGLIALVAGVLFWMRRSAERQRHDKLSR